jgi:hypothetical protein
LNSIMVMDGQGGGIGKTIIKRLRDVYAEEIEILALGTNSLATSQMMKAGANRGATGENAIVKMASSSAVIVGPLAIIMANSMMGEVTPKMAEAISSSRAMKILIPLTRENITILGVSDEPLPHLIDRLIEKIKEVF